MELDERPDKATRAAANRAFLTKTLKAIQEAQRKYADGDGDVTRAVLICDAVEGMGLERFRKRWSCSLVTAQSFVRSIYRCDVGWESAGAAIEALVLEIRRRLKPPAPKLVERNGFSVGDVVSWLYEIRAPDGELVPYELTGTVKTVSSKVHAHVVLPSGVGKHVAYDRLTKV